MPTNTNRSAFGNRFNYLNEDQRDVHIWATPRDLGRLKSQDVEKIAHFNPGLFQHGKHFLVAGLYSFQEEYTANEAPETKQNQCLTLQQTYLQYSFLDEILEFAPGKPLDAENAVSEETKDYCLVKAKDAVDILNLDWNTGQKGLKALAALAHEAANSGERYQRPTKSELEIPLLDPGHYFIFRCMSLSRLVGWSPTLRRPVITSRVNSGHKGFRRDGFMEDTRTRDMICGASGLAVPLRNRGHNFKGFQAAHIIPVIWIPLIKKIIPNFDIKQLNNIFGPDLDRDPVLNAILLTIHLHDCFDDYQFGFWPNRFLEFPRKKFTTTTKTLDPGKFRGYRLEKGGATALSPRFKFHPKKGVTEEMNKEEQEMLEMLLAAHFRTCLAWHVGGFGHHQ
uniref:HNH nuclease domain-containing protein n=1 Tax=Mycena chlorophos TaxID=658473 RepID=A0ABQ0M3Q5_MYCCL|nr:predicted protein [Mycena chlorophos]